MAQPLDEENNELLLTARTLVDDLIWIVS